MIHIRIDNEDRNDKRRFACGLGPGLPPGDQYFFAQEVLESSILLSKVDCPGCNPEGTKPLGTPLSELSGRPGHPGYREFCRIAQSWGYP